MEISAACCPLPSSLCCLRLMHSTGLQINAHFMTSQTFGGHDKQLFICVRHAGGGGGVVKYCRASWKVRQCVAQACHKLVSQLSDQSRRSRIQSPFHIPLPVACCWGQSAIAATLDLSTFCSFSDYLSSSFFSSSFVRIILL